MSCKTIQENIVEQLRNSGRLKKQERTHVLSCPVCKRFCIYARKVFVFRPEEATREKTPESLWPALKERLTREQSDTQALSFLGTLRRLLDGLQPSPRLTLAFKALCTVCLILLFSHLRMPADKGLLEKKLDDRTQYLMHIMGYSQAIADTTRAGYDVSLHYYTETDEGL